MGACSVVSETDSDFDEDNRVDDCVVWDSDSEMVGEPEPTGVPAEIDRTSTACSRMGGGRTLDSRLRVSFHPYCSREDKGFSAFRCIEYSQESAEWGEIDWTDPVAECMPKRLVRRRVSDGLKADQAVRRLDVPLTTRPKRLKMNVLKGKTIFVSL